MTALGSRVSVGQARGGEDRRTPPLAPAPFYLPNTGACPVPHCGGGPGARAHCEEGSLSLSLGVS